MGFRICQFCQTNEVPPATSSGETYLSFDNGRTFHVPDMLPHYILEHDFHPPDDFVDAVMNGKLVGGYRDLSKSPLYDSATKVGWLTSNEYPRGDVGIPFLARLEQVLRKARQMGLRLQTKGIR